MLSHVHAQGVKISSVRTTMTQSGDMGTRMSCNGDSVNYLWLCQLGLGIERHFPRGLKRSCLSNHTHTLVHTSTAPHKQVSVHSHTDLEVVTDNLHVLADYTVEPLITDPPRSGQPLYSGQVPCYRLNLA